MESFLLCNPDEYDVTYAINPYMETCLGKIDRELARKEWQAFSETLCDLGAQIKVRTPWSGCPDMVFMSDPGLVVGNVFLGGRFSKPERSRENEAAVEWMMSLGYEVRTLPEGMFWEGNGELLCGLKSDGTVDGTLFGGFGIRSTPEAYDWVADQLGFELTKVELTDPYCYHLDTCFTALPGGFAMLYAPAVSAESEKAIRARFASGHIYEATREDVLGFGLNAIIVGRNIVSNAFTERMSDWLRDRGFQPIAAPVGEFVKAGGSTKCLSLKIHQI